MSDSDMQSYQERLDRISAIFSDIVTYAEDLSLTRCPYRDRHDLCTALFRCRNQRPTDDRDSDELICTHDGAFDYRSAWESNPRAYERTREKIVKIKRDAEERRRGRTGEDRER